MKKQSGFTLIELLLVLAIIGIISAIAIPALLSQRSRARDKAAISNMTGTMGDLIGTWDKAKESGAGSTSCVTAMEQVLKDANGRNDRNPWDTGTSAYNPVIGAASFTPEVLGQVEFAKTASNMLIGKVLVKNSVQGSTTVEKRSNLE